MLAALKTAYQYNANNQLIAQSKPNDFTNVNPATTRYYYDQLGRQIGVQGGVGTGAGKPTKRCAGLSVALHCAA